MPTKQEVSAVIQGMRSLENDQQMKNTLDPSVHGPFRRWSWRGLRSIKRVESDTARTSTDSSVASLDNECIDSFDQTVVIEEYPVNRPSSPKSVADMKCLKRDVKRFKEDVKRVKESLQRLEEDVVCEGVKEHRSRRSSLIQTVVDDFKPSTGDQKILRAIGRTATVNAAVLLTTITGGAAAASGVGLATGGIITGKRFGDGCANNDEKEVAKSLAVYGAATGASIGAQVVTGALLIGVAHVALPVAAAVAFGAGCCSGITAGAVSEWTVDGVMDSLKKKKAEDASAYERSRSEGAFSNSKPSCSTLKRSKSDQAVTNRKQGYKRRGHLSRPAALKRSHSDGLLIGFKKWDRKKNDLQRRHSFRF